MATRAEKCSFTSAAAAANDWHDLLVEGPHHLLELPAGRPHVVHLGVELAVALLERASSSRASGFTGPERGQLLGQLRGVLGRRRALGELGAAAPSGPRRASARAPLATVSASVSARSADLGRLEVERRVRGRRSGVSRRARRRARSWRSVSSRSPPARTASTWCGSRPAPSVEQLLEPSPLPLDHARPAGAIATAVGLEPPPAGRRRLALLGVAVQPPLDLGPPSASTRRRSARPATRTSSSWRRAGQVAGVGPERLRRLGGLRRPLPRPASPAASRVGNGARALGQVPAVRFEPFGASTRARRLSSSSSASRRSLVGARGSSAADGGPRRFVPVHGARSAPATAVAPPRAPAGAGQLGLGRRVGRPAAAPARPLGLLDRGRRDHALGRAHPPARVGEAVTSPVTTTRSGRSSARSTASSQPATRTARPSSASSTGRRRGAARAGPTWGRSGSAPAGQRRGRRRGAGRPAPMRGGQHARRRRPRLGAGGRGAGAAAARPSTTTAATERPGRRLEGRLPSRRRSPPGRPASRPRRRRRPGPRGRRPLELVERPGQRLGPGRAAVPGLLGRPAPPRFGLLGPPPHRRVGRLGGGGLGRQPLCRRAPAAAGLARPAGVGVGRLPGHGAAGSPPLDRGRPAPAGPARRRARSSSTAVAGPATATPRTASAVRPVAPARSVRRLVGGELRLGAASAASLGAAGSTPRRPGHPARPPAGPPRPRGWTPRRRRPRRRGPRPGRGARSRSTPERPPGPLDQPLHPPERRRQVLLPAGRQLGRRRPSAWSSSSASDAPELGAPPPVSRASASAAAERRARQVGQLAARPGGAAPLGSSAASAPCDRAAAAWRSSGRIWRRTSRTRSPRRSRFSWVAASRRSARSRRRRCLRTPAASSMIARRSSGRALSTVSSWPWPMIMCCWRPDPRVAQQLLDVEQPARGAVDGVLAVTRAEEGPGDRHLGHVHRQLARAVVDGEGDLGPPERRPADGAGEDDVLHLLRAQRARGPGRRAPRSRRRPRWTCRCRWGPPPR